MRTVLIVAVMLMIAIPVIAQVNPNTQSSQAPASQDPQQVKDLYIDAMGQLKTMTTLYVNLDYGIQVFTRQLSLIRTIPQLDSLRTARNIPNPEPATKKKDEKAK